MALAFIGLTLFQTALQAAQVGVTLNSDIQNEIDRQQGICDQIKNLKEVQIPKLQSMRGDLQQGQALSDSTKQSLFDLNESITATINQINDLKKQAFSKLLIQIVASILFVAIIALYILNKKGMLD
jgi:hypothetical protein